jgi:periplasmic protein CpxP/Spy
VFGRPKREVKSLSKGDKMKTMLALVLAAGLVLPGTLWAGQGKHGFSVDDKVKHMTEKLGLTSEQQSSLRAILEEKKEKMEALHEQMRALREEHREKIRAVLTDEQKAKYDEMKKNGKKKDGRGKKD